MTDDLRAIAMMLDEIVSAMPGVSTLFAADPSLLRSAKQLATREGPLPLVAVSSSDESLAIVVSIGVDGEEQAPSTAAAVAAAVRAALPERETTVSVRVSRVVL